MKQVTTFPGKGLSIAAHAIDLSRHNHRLLPRNKTTRPKLTPDTADAYIDWTMDNAHLMNDSERDAHLRAAELVIRMRMGDAQAKDTQHTLVRDGVIEAPPTA